MLERTQKALATLITPDKALTVVAAVIAAVTALLTALGIGSILTLGVLRNHHEAVIACVTLVFASGVMLFAFKPRVVWVTIAVLLALVALEIFVYKAWQESAVGQTPHLGVLVETTAAGLTKLNATVKADGLHDKQPVHFIALGHQRADVLRTVRAVQAGSEVKPASGSNDQTPLSATSVDPVWVPIGTTDFGSNAAGSIDTSFALEVSASQFDAVLVMVSVKADAVAKLATGSRTERTPCQNQPADVACTQVNLVQGTLRPAIAASLSTPDAKGNQTLDFTVSANSVPSSAVIAVTLWANAKPRTFALAPPDLAGKVQATFKAQVRTDTRICILAALVDAATATSSVDKARCDPTKKPLAPGDGIALLNAVMLPAAQVAPM
jgi:hypothetical protein